MAARRGTRKLPKPTFLEGRLVPAEGFEPPTTRLRSGCSTAELRRLKDCASDMRREALVGNPLNETTVAACPGTPRRRVEASGTGSGSRRGIRPRIVRRVHQRDHRFDRLFCRAPGRRICGGRRALAAILRPCSTGVSTGGDGFFRHEPAARSGRARSAGARRRFRPAALSIETVEPAVDRRHRQPVFDDHAIRGPHRIRRGAHRAAIHSRTRPSSPARPPRSPPSRWRHDASAPTDRRASAARAVTEFTRFERGPRQRQRALDLARHLVGQPLHARAALARGIAKRADWHRSRRCRDAG